MPSLFLAAYLACPNENEEKLQWFAMPPPVRTPIEYLSDTKKVIFSQLMTMIVEVSAGDTKNVKWLLLQQLQAILVGIF